MSEAMRKHSTRTKMKTSILQTRHELRDFRIARDWGITSLVLALFTLAHPAFAQVTDVYSTPGYTSIGGYVPHQYNNLLITNGAVVQSGGGIIGWSLSDGVGIVTGSGTIWSNGPNAEFYVGLGGTNNQLSILDGGKMMVTAGIRPGGLIGSGSADSGNTVLVSDPGSSWEMLDKEIDVGYSGSGNSLVVTNGGEVVTPALFIGRNPGSSNNKVLVSGANSIVSNSSANFMAVGYGGTGNQLVINNGGKVFATVPSTAFFLGYSGEGSSVVVDGTNSALYVASNTYIGQSSSGNRLSITNGGYVQVLTARIGYGAGSTNNSVVVSGNGSTLFTTTYLTVGSNSQSSGSGSLLVQDGGTWLGNAIYTGLNGTGNITNNGGIFEFNYTPFITTNSPNSIILTNGVISYRDVASSMANIAAADFSKITFQGDNAFRLNGVTNASVTSYNFATNNGQFFQKLQLVGAAPTWQGGELTVGSGGELLVSNAGAATVAALFTNAGSVRVVNSKVTYAQAVTLSGRYVSDPSTNTFNSNVTVTASGSLSGSNGDLFVFNQNLVNQSTNRTQFNLAYATVLFTNGTGLTNHVLDLSGSGALDMGSNWLNAAQLATNFSMGTLSLAAGNNLTLSGTAGSNALYVGWLDLGGSTNNLAAMLSLGVNLYYEKFNPNNTYLGGLTYSGLGAGLLIPIPEPVAMTLVMAGALSLLALKRRGN